MKIDYNLLIDGFGLSTLKKGVDYCEENRVLRLYQTSSETFTAEVKGTKRYEVQLDFRDNYHECTCPVRFNCKHAAAVAWELYSRKSPVLTENWQLENWLQRLEKLNNDQKNNLHPNSSPRVALFYIISRSFPPTLSCKVVRLKKDGSPGQSHPASITLTRPPKRKDVLEYWDEADRRVFSEAMWTDGYDIVALNSLQNFKTLEAAIATKRCHLGDIYTPPLTLGERKEARFEWKLDPVTQMQKITPNFDFPFTTLGEDPYFYINTDTYQAGPLEFHEKSEIVNLLLSAPPVPLASSLNVAERFSRVAAAKHLQPPTPKREKSIGTPKPLVRFSFFEPDYDYDILLAQADLFFIYEEKRVRYGSSETIVSFKNNGAIDIERSLEKEELAADKLKELYWLFKSDNRFEKTESSLIDATLRILNEEVPLLKSAGWQIEFDSSFPFTETQSNSSSVFNISEGDDSNWFDLDLGVRFGDRELNLVRFFEVEKLRGTDLETWIDTLRSADPEKPIVIRTDKNIAFTVNAGLLVQFFDVLESSIIDVNDGTASFPKWNIGEISKKLPTELFKEDKLRALVAASEELKNPPHIEATVDCQLRPYQQQGVNWLQAMRRAGFPAILADEMGLGKTVQTLAHLSVEKSEGRLTGPSLLVGPTSLMHNWFSEIQRFLPSLKALILHGSDRNQHFNSLKEYDLILTTYPLLSRDEEVLAKESFEYLILDEAHQIKNPKTLGHQVLCSIRAKQKIFLTGTPMENHLGEMWGLMSLLQPGLLGSEKQFTKTFRQPIEKKGDSKKQAILSKRVEPFILRRTKRDVELDLPEKTITIQKIEMGKKQAAFYEAIRFKVHSKVMDEIKKKGLKRAHITVLDGLLKLRQACCDPKLVKIDYPNLNLLDSAKLNFICETLPQLVEGGRKILLFSQFTSMLALIEEELKKLNIPYSLLTGDTKDRKTPVATFQSGNTPVMLLSLKAGGVGLNLTAADTVIHYDPWWNPQAENQATDRAHRIGQKNPVHVYKLVTHQTIEEKILVMQEKKAKLVEGLFNPEKSEAFELTFEEIHELFT